MTKATDLTTPSFIVDLDKLERNLREMGELCQTNGKLLCPMVKSHKSTAIVDLQVKYGATAFLVGTLDEAEKLIEHDHKEIVLPYPVAGAANIARVITLARQAHITLSFDGLDAVEAFEAALAKENITLDYLIIVDCGLHRLGVSAENVALLAKELAVFSHLKFKGISTHPGQVYGKSNIADVECVAAEEARSLKQAKKGLEAAGFSVPIVATGSTPTAPFVASDKTITTLRPGNYVFYDAIQVALGVVPLERCALTVLATVIAHPAPDMFIMDAGSKCFGLDKGAHSVSLVSGYGIVKDHPELAVESLSEEIGKLRVTGVSDLMIGDKLEIIPNHACPAANMTNWLIGHRGGNVETILDIDARGGAVRKPAF
ncbi:MAG TPA: alanine racemase [Negativicutes bacterium]|nr:alanine racemase [Negativicutes bacterium]